MKSPVSWIGNKTSILHILYVLFPKEYDRYIEPFGGSASVILGKPKKDKFEVFNDYNHNLVNLYRCMRDRPMALIRELGFLNLNSRDDFTALRKFFEKESFSDEFMQEELDLTSIMLPDAASEEMQEIYTKVKEDYDLRRAAMYLKLIRYSYSSGCRSFACQPFSIRSLFRLIQEFSERMEGVIIENQDFETLIKHYDREGAFIYCDPPYLTSEYVYACGFTLEDHLRLCETLKNVKGKFLLSYNDCPEIRRLYSGFNMFEFKRIHSMVQKYDAGKEFSEILISNYDLYEREKDEPVQMTLFGAQDEERRLKERIIYGRQAR